MKQFWKSKREQIHQATPNQNYQLKTEIVQNEDLFKKIFQNCSDVMYRSIVSSGQVQWLIVFAESLVDEKLLNREVFEPLMSKEEKKSIQVKDLNDQFFFTAKTKVTSEINVIVDGILKGQAAILKAGESKAMMVAMPKKEERSLIEPPTEPVIRGSRIGFNENISTNIGLVRNSLRTSRLKMESHTIGELTQTKVVLTYVEGTVDDSIVEEVRKRVTKIQIDGILESAYIEEFIEDLPFSPFPQIQNTERPDVVVAALLEGKVAILVDSTPFALIVPMTFWSALQASEDYYERSLISSSIRWLRFLFLFIAVFAPSMYVAITTFHQEMIPTNLLLSIAAARESTPFPALFEALIMEISFEGLREAGVRLPKPIGSAVSIVGALVIGEAAVQAGIVSPPMVIIVSVTGIAAFIIPRFNFANGIRLLRFPMILLAGTLGLYGVALGFLGILLHVTSLRSFGVPYFTPIAPFSIRSLKDTFIRTPIWNRLRTEITGSKDFVRVRPDEIDNSKTSDSR
jgi:spore germination protein